MYKCYYCQHTAWIIITTVSTQHVRTLLLSAYSVYKHYYCHHTACTNITTVCIQHVQTLLLSAYSMNHHYFCQHTACTNITTVSIQHVPTLLLSAYRKYQNSCCLPTEYSIIISVSTRPNNQHVPLFPICVTKIQLQWQHISRALTDRTNATNTTAKYHTECCSQGTHITLLPL